MDTEILQLDGTSVHIDEIARRHQAGQEQWVYSCTEEGRIVPGKVEDAHKARDSEPQAEVELDNGEKVKCTLAHRWMLRDGTYKRAADLKPGESLMPLYRSWVRPSSISRLKYEKVLHPGTGRVEWTHSMVSRSLGFAAGRGYVIHHDFNGLRHLNNDPRNLRRMTQAEHRTLHNEASKNGGIKAAHAAWMALDPEERSRQSSERARKRWQDPDYRAGGRDRLETSKAATDSSLWGNHSPVTFEDIDQATRNLIAEGSKLTWQAVADRLGCSQDVIYDRLLTAGFESWKAYKWTLVQRDKKWERKMSGLGDGRRVPISFSDIDLVCRELVRRDLEFGWRDVAEVFGCDQTVLYNRIRAVGFSGWKNYKASLTQNHKVVDVRPVDPEAVYDIDVERWHNFAIKAGVFVHSF